MKIRLAIFLSGSGSNARNICDYFSNNEQIEVSLLLSNKKESGTKNIAEENNLHYIIFDKQLFYNSLEMQDILNAHKIDFIILAGFLWLFPNYLLQSFKDRVINIHPALLPKYGGKGMHGMHVHQAVFENHEKESGITIHLCNEKYDDGKILFQASVTLTDNDTPTTISQKVLKLEHQFFPKVIEIYILEYKK
ncbi:MAG: phosphoribosylglycinamide formyltransferase [Sphingobacteriales bacterium]|nr:MAG: phosphoribosylglycinamide formyltransferase [Sphingobacteriales bacterium]